MNKFMVAALTLFEDAALWVAGVFAAAGIWFWYSDKLPWWIAVPLILVFFTMLTRTLIIVFSGELVIGKIVKVNKAYRGHKECVIHYIWGDRIVEIVRSLQGKKYDGGVDVVLLVGNKPNAVRVVCERSYLDE